MMSDIITILTALLTGGFLLFFIEGQQTVGVVTQRFYGKMKPFMNKFCSYLKFTQAISMCYEFHKNNVDNEDVQRFKENLEILSKEANPLTMSGTNYPVEHYSAEQLDNWCEIINDTWYCLNEKRNNILPYIGFDENHAYFLSDCIREFLSNISYKYNNHNLDIFLLSEVSGDFYINMYKPNSHLLRNYEFWKHHLKIFRWLDFLWICFVLIGLLVALFLKDSISMLYYQLFCALCSGFLIIMIYNLMKLETLSQKIGI